MCSSRKDMRDLPKLMFRIFRVSGQSLSPDYQDGDFVLLATAPFLLSRLKAGEVIVFEHASYGMLIKRITQILPGEVLVTGTHPHSLDSRKLGPIERRSITGKVLWHIRKPRGD